MDGDGILVSAILSYSVIWSSLINNPSGGNGTLCWYPSTEFLIYILKSDLSCSFFLWAHQELFLGQYELQALSAYQVSIIWVILDHNLQFPNLYCSLGVIPKTKFNFFCEIIFSSFNIVNFQTVVIRFQHWWSDPSHSPFSVRTLNAISWPMRVADPNYILRSDLYRVSKHLGWQKHDIQFI